MAKFKHCFHHKCLKRFFGFSNYHSVTSVLLELCLPSFDTVIQNYIGLLLGVIGETAIIIGAIRCVCRHAFHSVFIVFLLFMFFCVLILHVLYVGPLV